MRINDHEANRLRLLKAIRRAEPVARTELVQLTGLAGGTISELTADLLRSEILVEEKAPVTGSGRPRMQLHLNPDKYFVLGASLVALGGLEIDIVNLRGDRLYSRTLNLSHADSLDELALQLVGLIDDAIATSPFSKDSIHSVGVGLPATVDSARGMLHWLQTYTSGPFPLAEIMGQRLGLPVTIDNSPNIVARAEHWFGDDRQMDDFCLVMVGLGIGLAQYVDGMLWSGSGGLNPEFSHMKMAYDGGRQCVCGASGCLLTYSSIYGIVCQISEKRGIDAPDLLHMAYVFEEFAREARLGEPVATEVFKCAGHILGTAMANHVNFWNPKRVIVLCASEATAGLMATPFHAALQHNTLPVFLGQASVEFRVASEERYSKGAAALVLEQLYRVPKDQPGRARQRTLRAKAHGNPEVIDLAPEVAGFDSSTNCNDNLRSTS